MGVGRELANRRTIRGNIFHRVPRPVGNAARNVYRGLPRNEIQRGYAGGGGDGGGVGGWLNGGGYTFVRINSSCLQNVERTSGRSFQA